MVTEALRELAAIDNYLCRLHQYVKEEETDVVVFGSADEQLIIKLKAIKRQLMNLVGEWEEDV